MKVKLSNFIKLSIILVFFGTTLHHPLYAQHILGKVKKEVGKTKSKKTQSNPINSDYKTQDQNVDKDLNMPKPHSMPFAMKECNTSSEIYDKIEFSGFSTSGYKSRNAEFFVTLKRSDDGFEWKKKVTYKKGYDKSDPYQAKTFFTYGPNGEKLGDEKDKQVFYLTPSNQETPYGILQMASDFLNEGSNAAGIILFGEQSPKELKAEVQKMRILNTDEEIKRTSLEKNHVGEIVFSSQEIKASTEEKNLKTKFILGEPIYARVVLKDWTNSMRELFIKEGLSPDYQNSWPLLEYYKNGELLGVFENTGRGFTGFKQASANRDQQELRERFDKSRSFGETLLEADFYIFNTAAPLWNALVDSNLKNETYKIDIKYYIVHSPSEGHDETLENKGRTYKKLISEGSFDLSVTNSGKEIFCSKTKLCKK